MRADLHLYGSKLGGPGLSADRRNPYPTKAKKEKQTSLIRRGYLLAPLSGDRARRSSVQNLYMAAKTKLLHQSSLRGRTYGPSPSKQQEHLPVSLQTSRNFYMKSSQTNNRTKLRRSAGDMIQPRTSMKIGCGSTVKCLGATVGDVTPGYPRGGPNTLIRIGWVGPTESRRSSSGLLAAQDYRKLPAV